jgi:hypothetical protein
MNRACKIFISLTLFLLLLSPVTGIARVKDSIQPTENIYNSIVKPKHSSITFNLISNFGKVEVPTTTIITHATNDFKILRFEKDQKGIWRLAKKDTILAYDDLGPKLILSLENNLAIKKSPERTKMIIVMNVPSFWTRNNTNVKFQLKPWTLDRVGRLQFYMPGSLLDGDKNLKDLYTAIRANQFFEPGAKVSPQIQHEFNLIAVGDIYISKGLESKMTSQAYQAIKFDMKKK